MSDTTKFDLHCTSLGPSLKIAFDNAPGHKATHFKKTSDRLVFAWDEHAGKDFLPFLIPLTPESALLMVGEWITKHATFPYFESDGDVEAKRSWHIYCEEWGHVDHNHYAFVVIEPEWALYGK